MDVASSIAGLVALTDLVFTKVFWYLKRVKNAEKEVTAFSTEIKTLYGILHSLHLVAFQLEGEQYDRSIRVHHVHYCYETLEGVKIRLQKAFPDTDKNSSAKLLLHKLKWPFSISETKDLIANLQRHKSTLTLALSADNLSALLRALENQNQIQDGINEITEIGNEMTKRWAREDRIAMTSHQRKVLSFFCKVDPQTSHDIALSLRHPGTGVW
jgi:hypothetical protein